MKTFVGISVPTKIISNTQKSDKEPVLNQSTNMNSNQISHSPPPPKTNSRKKNQCIPITRTNSMNGFSMPLLFKNSLNSKNVINLVMSNAFYKKVGKEIKGGEF